MDTKVNTSELLALSLERYSYADIADKLGVTSKTVRNWSVKEDGPPKYQSHQLQSLLFGNESNVPEDTDFTFIDLFAGIGGIRMGFESSGGHCVFTSEWDKYALKTYCENYGTDHTIAGDITNIIVSDIPSHDVLLAGFPCQPFSIAGVSKKNSLVPNIPQSY
jgi:DNA (cytosine-5)-methyltransferase 1